MSPRKVDFALSFRAQITALAKLVKEMNELNLIYFASGYDIGGSDPIQDSDLTGHDLTAAQIVNMSTITTNLEALLSNDVPTQGDYRALINALRTVG